MFSNVLPKNNSLEKCLERHGSLGGPLDPMWVLLAMWLDLVGQAQSPWTGGGIFDSVGEFGDLQT